MFASLKQFFHQQFVRTMTNVRSRAKELLDIVKFHILVSNDIINAMVYEYFVSPFYIWNFVERAGEVQF